MDSKVITILHHPDDADDADAMVERLAEKYPTLGFEAKVCEFLGPGEGYAVDLDAMRVKLHEKLPMSFYPDAPKPTPEIDVLGNPIWPRYH